MKKHYALFLLFLICGGNLNGQTFWTNVTDYPPIVGQPTHNIRLPQVWDTSTFLYIGGGQDWNNYYTNYFYRYDVINNTWLQLANISFNNCPNNGVGCFPLGFTINNEIYYFRAEWPCLPMTSQNYLDVFKYNKVSNTWSSNPLAQFYVQWSPPYFTSGPRFESATAHEYNGSAYLFGVRMYDGVLPTFDHVTTHVFEFNASTNTISVYDTVGVSAAGLNSFMLGSKVYFVGGHYPAGGPDFFSYDIPTKSFVQLNPPSFMTGLSTLSNGIAFSDGISKGFFGLGGSSAGYFQDLWMFDEITGNWTQVTSPNQSQRSGSFGVTSKVDNCSYLGLGDGPNTTNSAIWKNCFFTGIEENITDNYFSISPNPSDGKFTIHFNIPLHNGEVNIYNTLGENIFTQNISNETKKEITIKNIFQGIYMVKVFDGEKYYCKKIIIEQN